jgi:hypothetical protein
LKGGRSGLLTRMATESVSSLKSNIKYKLLGSGGLFRWMRYLVCA